MPQIQYPFIDIAVHPAVRARFAAGEAIVLFSRDMANVLWANGEGARLFGHDEIYDLLDDGLDRAGVAFRQLSSTVRQLNDVGDRRTLMMRIGTGFVSQAISAEVTLVEIRRGEIVVIFTAPVAANKSSAARAAAILKGFDDPDTHMAVLDDNGEVLVASTGYAGLGILPETSRSLIAAAMRSGEGLIKRPIASAAGYLPAAMGRISNDPPFNLLFCVETVLGRMDPPHEEGVQPEIENVAAPAEDAVSHEEIEEDVSLPGVDGADVETPISASQETDHLPTEAEVVQLPADEFPEPEPLAAVAADEQEGEDVASSEMTMPEGEPSPEMPDVADLPHTELAADIVESEADLATGDMEPEEHAEADMAEAALNEVDSEDDVADLAALDGATPDDMPAVEVADTEAADEPIAEAATNLDDASVETDADDAVEVGADDIAAHAASDMPMPAEPETSVAPETAIASKSEQADHAVADEPATPAAFEFHREGRPVRFVWKLDAQGNFAEVSDEFSRTVGPHAGAINGMAFRDLAHLFNLDPENEIARLLERRDTWSGRTIRWPVEGTDLVVPVDLAALPTYSRNREFDGFRGFGIIRVADAETDPHAIGMTFGPAGEETVAAEAADGPLEEEPVAEAASPDVASSVDEIPDTQPDADNSAVAEEPAQQDEFKGEVPALKVVSNPLADFSDKIIQLEERRTRGREGLSQTEQNAFREIARQLEPFGKRPNESLTNNTEDTAEAEQSETSETRSAQDAAGENVVALANAGANTSADQPTTEANDEAFEVHAAEDLGADDDDEWQEDEQASVDDRGLTAAGADQIPVAILIHAGDRLIHANSEFKRFSGYHNLADLDRAGGLDALITRREGPEAGVYMVAADGRSVPVSARLQSVRYEGTKQLMLTLMEADAPLSSEAQFADDQQAAHRLAALKVEANELHSILETATDGVVVLDTDGRIRSMNRSASALFNFEESETRGKPFAMLFAHESQKAVQDYLSGLAGHGVASVLNDGREVIGREASGGFIPLFMTLGRMPGSNSYCAVIRDITQWKRSEEELRTAKRAAETANQHKSDFLARVSHEIRTPLNAIIGFADMIASEHFGPAGHSRYVEYANDIGRSGRHVLDIVNDLLDISKIEAGEMDLEFAAVGINDCVSEAVSLVQPQANAQRVIIRTSLSQSVPDVVADLRSIKQIAINILANAIRFTPSGGQIVVSSAYEPNGAVTLRIRDTGVGMSKSELEQAMRPFGQVSPGARKRGDGTGLGLPLTKAMTEANRAVFSIQSAPSEGTLVEITFPPQRVLAD